MAALAGEVLGMDSWKKIGKSRYVNDKQITDHYAIIPTGQGLGNIGRLSPLSEKVYQVICRRFLAICTASAVVSMLLLDFAGHNLSLIGAAVCMAGGFGIICSESQSTTMAMVDNTRRSLANNTYLIGLDSGMALGPMIGGFLYGHVAAQYFYPCLMTTAVLSTTVYFIWKKNVSYSGT